MVERKHKRKVVLRVFRTPWNALCFFLEKSTSRANGTERNGKRANFGATNDLILAVFFFVQMHSH